MSNKLCQIEKMVRDFGVVDDAAEDRLFCYMPAKHSVVLKSGSHVGDNFKYRIRLCDAHYFEMLNEVDTTRTVAGAGGEKFRKDGCLLNISFRKNRL